MPSFSPAPATPATELPDRTLDIDEVATYLNCCRATVRREIARRRLRAYKVGQRWRFTRDDVLAYLDRDNPASVAERAAWDAYIRKLAASAPPLSAAQITALSALLDSQPAGGRGSGAA